MKISRHLLVDLSFMIGMGLAVLYFAVSAVARVFFGVFL